ncbi:uncharacterized protein LOC119067246 [Bradysia coprophila]|uniref:uncharacterized protein LOC119067246 n=1 Tax=Bradysia coprophila TaxID=38358 RepID=UPI00187D9B56|nr:uncharacterized protein LOC119067246 [Bradysia coprophila]
MAYRLVKLLTNLRFSSEASNAIQRFNSCHSLVNVPATQCTAIDNGRRVAAKDSNAQTGTVGHYTDTGSRYEDASNNGVAHISENMASQGRSKRSPTDLKGDVVLNASYTSRDPTFRTSTFHRAYCNSKSSVPSFINMPIQNNSPKLNSISRHMSSYTSLTSVKIEQLQEIDGVNIDDVIRNEIENINEMIKVRELRMSVINEIYESLCKLISLLGVPTINTKESDKNFFVGSVLFSIAAFIRKEYQYDLSVQSEAPLKDFNIHMRGRMDFVVTDGKRKLVVIECKRHNADFGLVQCILALKHIYDTNNDGGDTFGFTTNGLEWRFVKYNGDSEPKVKLFEKQVLITTYMHLPVRKERWMEHNTLILHIIFAAILSALNPTSIKLTEDTVTVTSSP